MSDKKLRVIYDANNFRELLTAFRNSDITDPQIDGFLDMLAQNEDILHSLNSTEDGRIAIENIRNFFDALPGKQKVLGKKVKELIDAIK